MNIFCNKQQSFLAWFSMPARHTCGVLLDLQIKLSTLYPVSC